MKPSDGHNEQGDPARKDSPCLADRLSPEELSFFARSFRHQHRRELETLAVLRQKELELHAYRDLRGFLEAADELGPGFTKHLAWDGSLRTLEKEQEQFEEAQQQPTLENELPALSPMEREHLSDDGLTRLASFVLMARGYEDRGMQQYPRHIKLPKQLIQIASTTPGILPRCYDDESVHTMLLANQRRRTRYPEPVLDLFLHLTTELYRRKPGKKARSGTVQWKRIYRFLKELGVLAVMGEEHTEEDRLIDRWRKSVDDRRERVPGALPAHYNPRELPWLS